VPTIWRASSAWQLHKGQTGGFRPPPPATVEYIDKALLFILYLGRRKDVLKPANPVADCFHRPTARRASPRPRLWHRDINGDFIRVLAVQNPGRLHVPVIQPRLRVRYQPAAIGQPGFEFSQTPSQIRHS